MEAASTLRTRKSSTKESLTNEKQWLSATACLAVLVALLLCYSWPSSRHARLEHAEIPIASTPNLKPDARLCLKSCSVEIVESIPQNLTFDGFIPRATSTAWLELVSGARSSLAIAAYKSSLRGKHVLGNSLQQIAEEGEAVYDAINNAGINRKLSIRMVENGLSKDKGDNEDGKSLHGRGALNRRSLNLRKFFEGGTMHSKFLIADNRDFYLGSANLDWRSLNQKMELGVFVTNCPCLAEDLNNLFDTYWHSATADTVERFHEIQRHQPAALYNMQHPLTVMYEGAKTEVYLASSPKPKDNPSRTWDLDAFLREINRAQKFLFVHVMDYFPMFMYSNNKKFWPVLDNAIRAAIMRGVDVKMLVAALHYPEVSLRFLKSLEALRGIQNNATMEARVFKVPTLPDMQHILRRERRTHNKFIVTENAAIIGTSNWAADYFEGKGTGVAIVVNQKGAKKPFVSAMRDIFERDWQSEYTHTLDSYLSQCVEAHTGVFCETEKDLSLLATASA